MSLNSVNLMHFTKTLIIAALIAASATPAKAIKAIETKMPKINIQGIYSNWDPSSIERVRTLNAELASNASWYGPGFHGRRTASGEIFNQNALTAAHRSLPFGTRVLVTNLNNLRSVVVMINDDGPHIAGRVIDLSKAAAAQIGMLSSGTAPVRLQVLR